MRVPSQHEVHLKCTSRQGQVQQQQPTHAHSRHPRCLASFHASQGRARRPFALSFLVESSLCVVPASLGFLVIFRPFIHISSRLKSRDWSSTRPTAFRPCSRFLHLDHADVSVLNEAKVVPNSHDDRHTPLLVYRIFSLLLAILDAFYVIVASRAKKLIATCSV